MVNNHELRDNTEQSAENDWDDLEQLGKDGSFESQNAQTKVAEHESADARDERIADAAAKVRETYQNMEQPAEIDPTFDPDYDFGATDAPTKKESKFASRTANRYAAKERARVDRLKAEINDSWDTGEYENRQITTESSTRQKFRRLLMDRLGIRTKKSEDLREREATAIALKELNEERTANAKAAEEQATAAKAQKEAAKTAEEARKEQEAFEKDMFAARDEIEKHKAERLRNERTQEIVERDLNERLLTPDKLEEAVLMETEGVSKRTEKYGDQDIPVYDLRGLPFSILSHTVDYRSSKNEGEIGTETYRAVMEDPSIWAQTREQAEQASGYGTRDGNARGDSLSTSYFTSGKNLESHVSGDLMYGFAAVGGDSIISISNGDGGTGNMSGTMETKVSDIHGIDKLESAGSTASYNEVLLRRYDADGRAKRPDFIITENGHISEAAKRHAAYFGIPIVNIEKNVYEKEAENRGQELVDSIDETNSYEEIDNKLDELLSMSQFKNRFAFLKSIGRAEDLKRKITNTEEERKIQNVAELEMVKRLDFLMDTLEKTTEEIEAATESGELASSRVPGFESFTVSMFDVQSGDEINDRGRSRKAAFQGPGSCSDIFFDFKLAGSGHNVSMHIYDGAHPYKPEEAMNLSQEDIDNADSSYYEAFKPVVERYYKALQRNREFAKQAA